MRRSVLVRHGASRRTAGVLTLRGTSGLLALSSVLLLVGCAARAAGLETAANTIRAAGSPLIKEVTYMDDWLDGEAVYVRLVADARKADAHSLWCDLLMPAGLNRTNTAVYRGTETWDAPTDCSGS